MLESVWMIRGATGFKPDKFLPRFVSPSISISEEPAVSAKNPFVPKCNGTIAASVSRRDCNSSLLRRDVWQCTYFVKLLIIISIQLLRWLSLDGSFSCTQHLGYYPISWKGISTTPEAFAFERGGLLTLFAINLECDRTGPRESNIRANRWMTIVLSYIRTKV